MRSTQTPGPGQDDGEELSSSPSSFSGTGKSEPEQPTEPVRPEGGAADLLAPGAKLAGLVTAATGPGGTGLGTLTDREVLGLLGAGHKLAAGRHGWNWSPWPSSPAAAPPWPPG